MADKLDLKGNSIEADAFTVAGVPLTNLASAAAEDVMVDPAVLTETDLQSALEALEAALPADAGDIPYTDATATEMSAVTDVAGALDVIVAALVSEAILTAV